MEDLSKTHWMALKKMVEARGLEWKDKATAIKALTAAGVTEAEAPGIPAAPAPAVVKPAPVEVKPAAKPKGNGLMLDRDRAFGQICGTVEGFPTALYEQGGHFFDAEGMKV